MRRRRRRINWKGWCFQAEGGMRDLTVTGVQTCALPISAVLVAARAVEVAVRNPPAEGRANLPLAIRILSERAAVRVEDFGQLLRSAPTFLRAIMTEIGRASCRERG